MAKSPQAPPPPAAAPERSARRLSSDRSASPQNRRPSARRVSLVSLEAEKVERDGSQSGESDNILREQQDIMRDAREKARKRKEEEQQKELERQAAAKRKADEIAKRISEREKKEKDEKEARKKKESEVKAKIKGVHKAQHEDKRGFMEPTTRTERLGSSASIDESQAIRTVNSIIDDDNSEAPLKLNLWKSDSSEIPTSRGSGSPGTGAVSSVRASSTGSRLWNNSGARSESGSGLWALVPPTNNNRFSLYNGNGDEKSSKAIFTPTSKDDMIVSDKEKPKPLPRPRLSESPTSSPRTTDILNQWDIKSGSIGDSQQTTAIGWKRSHSVPEQLHSTKQHTPAVSPSLSSTLGGFTTPDNASISSGRGISRFFPSSQVEGNTTPS